MLVLWHCMPTPAFAVWHLVAPGLPWLQLPGVLLSSCSFLSFWQSHQQAGSDYKAQRQFASLQGSYLL